jgi:Ca-activated chloride channel family protein
MSFASPLWLLALAAVPLAVLASVVAGRRRRRYAVRYTVVETLAGVAAALPRRRRHLPAVLGAVAAAALVLAVARPQMSVAVPVERASIMLVTDTSGSMNAGDVDPTRIAAARRAATRFVDEVPEGQRVGLVSFADGATVLQTPTDDREALSAAIGALRAQGATATGEGLEAALDQLRAEEGEEQTPAAIVLLSDGKRTSGRDPIPVARDAARAGIPVYTISLGTPGGTVENPSQPWLPPQQVPPDPETMREIARVARGQAFTVEDAGRLDRIYERLGSRLGTETEEREVTAAFAGGALLLLLAAVALGLRGRARLP